MYVQEPTVIHGDLGATNVIVQKLTHQPKLIDFGLSRIRSLGSMQPLGGTLRWSAPEVLMGGATPDTSADIFSFGRLVYFVVTGRVPLEGVCKEDVMKLARECSVLDPCLVDISFSLEGQPFQEDCKLLCQKCLAYVPACRASAAEIFAELDAWIRFSKTQVQVLQAKEVKEPILAALEHHQQKFVKKVNPILEINKPCA
ncbi:unnamed protein product [Polarella glacialis]|uniref:Protein kinase domain-containing protein n=1 Tax=Polarella glacialis TaxID=89957 RepID=A0A813M015_POLGL|nr:unnamed protein product [Polarella glacialis]CAE8742879.1 unnamed protein product [Polarella glacialis]